MNSVVIRKLSMWILVWSGALWTLTSLSACNTVEGAGEDIEEAGDEIEDAAD